MRIAPTPWEYVMYVDCVLHVRVHIDWKAGPKVPAPLAHLKRVKPLVRGAVASAQCEQSFRLELRRLHRTRKHGVVVILDPRDAIL